ncbi:unnamed protein product [Durusdinium trenchii]|uniref:Uncharacterized protein n=2 Tax=Durusdinium trenchii TaxID=1381693 RepID=A0ABP0PV92_9DINO
MGQMASYRPALCCEPRDRLPTEGVEGHHAVQLAATPLFKALGFTAYHTSIIVGERELFFDGAGIVEADAFWSHDWCQSAIRTTRPNRHKQIEVVDLGKSELDAAHAASILDPWFEEGTYDVLRKNCNSFTDAASWLLTKQRLNPKFNRMERWVLALEPMSLELIKRLISLLHQNEEPQQAPGYEPNPRAQDFNVEHVVSRLGHAQRHYYCCNRNSPRRKRLCHSGEEMSPCSWERKDTAIEKAWEPSVEDYPCRAWNPFDNRKENLTAGDDEPRVPTVIIERLHFPGPLPARANGRVQAFVEEDVVWSSN